MTEKNEDVKLDIWAEGIKSIFGSAKRSLLDFIDIIPTKTQEEKENLGKIKGRIHNDLSSACLSIGSLITLMRNGGDITPFSDIIIKREQKPRYNRRND